MQESRKFALVVSFSAAIVLGAVTNGASTSQRSHHGGAADDGVIATIIEYCVLASRIVIPPG
jgi:hypothetical protein